MDSKNYILISSAVVATTIAVTLAGCTTVPVTFGPGMAAAISKHKEELSGKEGARPFQLRRPVQYSERYRCINFNLGNALVTHKCDVSPPGFYSDGLEAYSAGNATFDIGYKAVSNASVLTVVAYHGDQSATLYPLSEVASIDYQYKKYLYHQNGAARFLSWQFTLTNGAEIQSNSSMCSDQYPIRAYDLNMKSYVNVVKIGNNSNIDIPVGGITYLTPGGVSLRAGKYYYSLKFGN